MSEQKNKGGRPSKVELAAKGITPTEVDVVVRMLKKHFGPAMARAIEISSNEDLPLDKQFRMNVELAKLYVEFMRVQKALREESNPSEGDENSPLAPVFNIVK